jgi:proteic killer suppression protein
MILGYRNKRTREFTVEKSQIKDLAVLPGNRFEALAGDRKGQYGIRVNDYWRLCFEWPDGATGPSNVEIVDYH